MSGGSCRVESGAPHETLPRFRPSLRQSPGFFSLFFYSAWHSHESSSPSAAIRSRIAEPLGSLSKLQYDCGKLYTRETCPTPAHAYVLQGSAAKFTVGRTNQSKQGAGAARWCAPAVAFGLGKRSRVGSKKSVVGISFCTVFATTYMRKRCDAWVHPWNESRFFARLCPPLCPRACAVFPPATCAAPSYACAWTDWIRVDANDDVICTNDCDDEQCCEGVGERPPLSRLPSSCVCVCVRVCVCVCVCVCVLSLSVGRTSIPPTWCR